ncbi:MAG: hypothetical protein Q9208_008417 [Pyrenodesmia sp. 3 TL-2023]
MPSQSDWRTRTINAGLVNAGHHRVSLDIDHVHLIDEATPQPDDVYGIPARLHHNRKMSRITGSPQAAPSNSSSPQEENPRSDDNIRQEWPMNGKQVMQNSPGTLVAFDELPVATQPAPVVSSPKQPDCNVRLARNWAARLERRASKRPAREAGPGNPKDRKTGTRLLQRLKDEGFFQVARNGRLQFAESQNQAAKRQQIYCNPMTLIGHCVSGLPIATVDLVILIPALGSTNLASRNKARLEPCPTIEAHAITCLTVTLERSVHIPLVQRIRDESVEDNRHTDKDDLEQYDYIAQSVAQEPSVLLYLGAWK